MPDLIDPTGNALQGLLGSIGGASFAGIPTTSSRDYFLSLMEDWYAAIPLRTQWLVLFDHFPIAITSSILQSLERTGADKKGWDVDQAVTELTSYGYQNVIGCVFVQGVQIPEEGNSNEYTAIDNNRGFLAGLVGGDRRPYNNQLNLEFRETNTSFVDFVIKPWMFLSAHYGLVARSSQESYKNVKSTIYIIEFGKTMQGISMVPRKTWKFYNCVPTTVDAYQLQYSEERMVTYSNGWNFTNYTLENNLDTGVPQILANLSFGISF